MNINYISGFFDADGSISISKTKSTDKYANFLKIDFTNNEIDILLNIQTFLFNTYQIKGHISEKPPRKKSHSTCYTLSYSVRNAVKLCSLLSSEHPKKKHRIQTVLKYYDLVVKRNGKYSNKELNRRIAFNRLFFWL